MCLGEGGAACGWRGPRVLRESEAGRMAGREERGRLGTDVLRELPAQTP